MKLDNNFSFLLEEEFDNKDYILKILEEIINSQHSKDFRNTIQKTRLIMEAFFPTIKKFCNVYEECNPIDLIKNAEINGEIKDSWFRARKLSNFASHYDPNNPREFNEIDGLETLHYIWEILNYFLESKKQRFDPNLYFNNDKKLDYKLVKPSVSELSKITETFKLDKVSLRDWFSSHLKIIIPLYQRKYTWNKENVETLINDVFQRMKDNQEHYLGTIAGKKVINDGVEKVKLIDGQQRITTSFIILIAIFDILKFLNISNELVTNIFKNNQFKNTSLDDGHDQTKVFKILTKDLSYENKEKEIEKDKYNGVNLWINYKSTRDILINKFNDQIEGYEDFVFTFLNKFFLSTISFDNEKYDNKREMEIFENFNSKGTSLEEYDLIKNHILNLCSNDLFASNDSTKEIIGLYNTHIDKKLSSKNKKDFFDCLIYYWTGEEIPKKGNYLLKAKKVINDMFDLKNQEFKSVEEFETFLKKLNEYIFIYNSIESKEYTTIVEKLRLYESIHLIVISKKSPLFIPLMFYLKDSGINEIEKLNFDKKRDIKKIFFSFAKIIVWHYLIKKQGDSTLKKNIYALIFQMRKNKIKFNYDEFVENFIKKLIEFIGEDGELKISDLINERFESSKLAEPTTILNLILYTMENGLENDVNKYRDPNLKFTLEHIWPQDSKIWRQEKPSLSDEEFEQTHKECVGKIGNFILLTGSKNSKISNKKFRDKKVEYAINSTLLYKNDQYEEIDISKKIDWNKSDIDYRTKSLVKYLKEYVFFEFIDIQKYSK